MPEKFIIVINAKEEGRVRQTLYEMDLSTNDHMIEIMLESSNLQLPEHVVLRCQFPVLLAMVDEQSTPSTAAPFLLLIRQLVEQIPHCAMYFREGRKTITREPDALALSLSDVLGDARTLGEFGGSRVVHIDLFAKRTPASAQSLLIKILPRNGDLHSRWGQRRTLLISLLASESACFWLDVLAFLPITASLEEIFGALDAAALVQTRASLALSSKPDRYPSALHFQVAGVPFPVTALYQFPRPCIVVDGWKVCEGYVPPESYGIIDFRPF